MGHFILFIAGHGLHDDDDDATYYYLTHGADLSDLSGTAVSFEEIEKLLYQAKPRNKLFLMDTCESGEVEDGQQAQAFALAGQRGFKPRTVRGFKKIAVKLGLKRKYVRVSRDRFIEVDLNRRSGAIVLSSSQGGEYSYESASIKNGSTATPMPTSARPASLRCSGIG